MTNHDPRHPSRQARFSDKEIEDLNALFGTAPSVKDEPDLDARAVVTFSVIGLLLVAGFLYAYLLLQSNLFG